MITLDIVRPAIAESVIKIVTRKESADKPSQVGETVLDQIPGGVTVMSSITPATELGSGARRKLPPTQAPYFRLLVKGERLSRGWAVLTNWCGRVQDRARFPIRPRLPRRPRLQQRKRPRMHRQSRRGRRDRG